MPPRDDSNASFPAAARLRTRGDFDRVKTHGIKGVNRQLVVYLLPHDDGARSRLGLSVGRRVGNSPERNRVKRCLRAAFRVLAPGLDPPADVFVIVRPAAPPKSTPEARRALLLALRRAGR